LFPTTDGSQLFNQNIFKTRWPRAKKFKNSKQCATKENWKQIWETMSAKCKYNGRNFRKNGRHIAMMVDMAWALGEGEVGMGMVMRICIWQVNMAMGLNGWGGS
jgi:stalled ribosome alternative rescue factor ArfA